MTLIIGVATTGPTDNLYKFKNFIEYQDVFGSTYTQLETITGSATAIVLDYPVFGGLFINVSGDGVNKLYNPVITDSTLTFGNYGGSSSKNVQLTYQPYLNEPDLLTSIQTYYQLSNDLPYVYRVPGELATVTLGDWVFTGRYPGSRYNDYYLRVSGSSLIIRDKSNLSEITFEIGDGLEEDIQDYFYKGLIDISVHTIGSNLSGSGYTSGGTDGEVNPEAIENLLNNVGLADDIDSVVILTEYNDAYGEIISDYIANDHHTCFFFAGPEDNVSIPTSLTENDNVAILMGTTNISYGNYIKERYAVEVLCPSIQGGVTLTNQKLLIDNYQPTYTKSELDELYSLGIMGVTRRASQGLVVYQGVTAGNTTAYHLTRIKSKVNSIAYNYLKQYLGKNLTTGGQPLIAKEIFNLISSIPEITINQVSADVITDDTMLDDLTADQVPEFFFGKILLVRMDINYYGEILTIKIGVNILPV